MVQYGIDISEYQEPSAIDEHRPEFVIAKLTEGRSYRVSEEWLGGVVERCRRLRLPLGFYHFARPSNNTVIAEVDHFMAALRTIPGGLQPHDALVLDFEVPPYDSGWAHGWLETVRQQAGRTPLFYSYPYFIEQMGGPPVGYPLWLAHYAESPALPCALWQFTDTPLDWNRFDGSDVAQFFASLNPKGAAAMQYGVIMNNRVDEDMARQTLHLGAGLVIYDSTTGKDIPNKLYVGASQMPQKPYEVDDKGQNWIGLTGRGAGRTKALMEWMVRAIHAVGPPPTA